jgi:hypothetical protein
MLLFDGWCFSHHQCKNEMRTEHIERAGGKGGEKKSSRCDINENEQASCRKVVEKSVSRRWVGGGRGKLFSEATENVRMGRVIFVLNGI